MASSVTFSRLQMAPKASTRGRLGDASMTASANSPSKVLLAALAAALLLDLHEAYRRPAGLGDSFDLEGELGDRQTHPRRRTRQGGQLCEFDQARWVDAALNREALQVERVTRAAGGRSFFLAVQVGVRGRAAGALFSLPLESCFLSPSPSSPRRRSIGHITSRSIVL